MARPATPPVTPWAVRFGVGDDYPWKGDNSSGFHPKYPEILLTRRDQVPYEAEHFPRLGITIPQPSDSELDRLFLDEKYQRRRLNGYHTWQAVVFSSLRGTPPTGMNINEDNWLPLFAKKRWYNLNRPISQELWGPLDRYVDANATWSVDNPLLWDAMRPAIELSDRLMRATLLHPFLDAILTVKNTDYFPHVTAEGLRGPPILARDTGILNLSEQQLLDTLIRYSEKIRISFLPAGLPGENSDADGLTTAVRDPNLGGALNGYDYVFIMLNPGLVRPLIDSSTTDATKAQALMNFALTLCHEMMHAFDRLRNMTRPADEELLDEPFYQQPGTNPEDSAWVSEVGMAWEQAMIGGFMTDSPRRKGTWGSGGLLAFVADFPNYIISKSYGNGVDVVNHENDIWFGYVFPAFLAQAYGSEEFWSIHVARYGLPALRVPKLAVTPINRFQHGAPTICQLGHAVQEYHPQLIQLGQDLRYRDAAWRMIRPWYQHHFNEWSLSPYCHTGLRNHPEKFRLAHRQGDELAAQEAFQSLGAFEYWEGKFVVTGCVLSQSSYWIDEAIGYLMMTIMPIRTQELMTSVPNFARNEWTPSLEATRDAAAQSQRPIEVDFTQYNDIHETVLRPRNVAFASGSNRGTRASLLMILKHEIPNRQNQFPLPDPVYQDVKAMFDNVERNAPQFENTDMWLPLQVNFVLPPWQTAQAQTNVGYGPATPYVPYNPTVQPQQHVPGAPAPSTPSSGSGTPSFHSASSSLVGTPNQSPGGSPPGPVSAPRRAANSARRAANAPDEVYCSVGEVGDHRSSGDLWVIVDDGAHGYDVYDATDVAEEMWADDIAAFNLDDHCEATLLGLKARPNFKQDLLAQGERRGKLIQPMRQQDIRERDGTNGKPFWISIGNDVFDISNYKFANPNEQNVCTMRPGGNPWNAVVNDGTIDYDQLLLDFKPYKCATIASKVPDKGPGPMEEFHFTTKEVAWHIYPESTMYTIIRGQVYNLTGYMDFHPGGTTILQKWAGKDSTLEFESYHEDYDRCLADYDYLRVGRVVEEKQMYQLTDKEVVLNGHIYNVSGIGTGKAERELLADIDRYGLQRKDITPVLNESWKPPPSLSLLVQRPDLITGKLAPPLREIDMDALHANNGGHIPHADDIKVPRDRVEADLQMPLWVCYRALVYDMTTVYKYGPEDIRAELNKFNGRYKGSVIPRTALAARLQEEYSCRVIGRLVRDTPRRRGIIVSDSDGDDRPLRRRCLS